MDEQSKVNEGAPVTFYLKPHGPIYVKGAFKIIDSNGKVTEIADEAWLCRCGKSKNKPYCDGSHKRE